MRGRRLITGQIIGLMMLIIGLGAFAHETRAQGTTDSNVMKFWQNNGGREAFGWVTDIPCPLIGENWNGVTCTGTRVTHLDLTCGSVKLQPVFHKFTFALTALKEFSLRSCFSGEIPATEFSGICGDTFGISCGLAGTTGEFIGFFNRATNYTKLRLDTGQTINGTISELFRTSTDVPAQNGLIPTRFTVLKTLYLTDTKMSGSIPEGVMQFTGTTDIRLNYASFSGELPAAGNSSKNIWLNGNQLEGVVPDYIRNATGTVYLRYNKFDVENTPPGNIDTLDPLWRATQTVPPTNVQVVASGNSALLTWTPIAYQQHGGYYEVLSSQTPGGPYISRGSTENSGGKTAANLTVTGLPTGLNYFVVRTFTPAHTGVFPQGCAQEVDCVTENNPNDLTSKNSAEASANILGPTAASVSIGGRVLSSYGRGVSNAVVTLITQTGATRSARTNAFGYYRFDEVEAGQVIVVSVASKRFQFAPQVITVNEELSGLDFIAAPENFPFRSPR